MNQSRRVSDRWSLADLIDFEALLAAEAASVSAHDRMRFARDVREQLPPGNALAQRRVGLKRWLAIQRDSYGIDAGALWQRALAIARLGLFLALGLTGMALAAGLCAAPGQTVHVVVFIAVTLLLPWTVFFALLIVRWLGARQRRGPDWILARLIPLTGRVGGGVATRQLQACRERLTDSAPARNALGAAIGGVLQWGAVGFNLGLVVAFAGSLMVFDVRFYWEATPQTDALMTTATQTVAAPWAGFWPAAVPEATAIEASRARYVDGRKRVRGDTRASAAWWRFLLLSLLVWGLLPRLLLVGASHWRLRRALARLTFQAPRHRELWRKLTAVERGAVAPAASDGALVLDVGGLGVTGNDVRGFLLRALRVNPQADHRIAVLDDAAETAADAALAARPAHVVLLVDARDISPRHIRRLHARIRAAAGNHTPVTWVVLSLAECGPIPPEPAALARWTRFIDGLRDPAAEVVAYDPGV